MVLFSSHHVALNRYHPEWRMPGCDALPFRRNLIARHSFSNIS
jgi:hypothetical protein